MRTEWAKSSDTISRYQTVRETVYIYKDQRRDEKPEDFEIELDAKFRVLAIDECTSIKNPDTRIACAVASTKCDHIVGASATFILNSIADIEGPLSSRMLSPSIPQKSDLLRSLRMSIPML